jgi:conjugative relaxase-like TrwC/TraI family protein
MDISPKQTRSWGCERARRLPSVRELQEVFLMLSIASVASAGAASSYYTKDNYYTTDAETDASSWAGAGALAAGLSGQVELGVFQALLEGRLPDGSTIGTGVDGKHAPGFDMTFSAPKSLSLLAYVGGDERLLAANMQAVTSTIAWAEKNLAETRMKGPGGIVAPVRTGNLVVALFQHDTNRNLDPQAHVHAVVANATQGPDGKWRALFNGKLWQANSVLGSIYHAQLRTEVEQLGYKVEITGKHGQFEIGGISREAVMAFSTRRQEVLDAYSQLTWQNEKTRNAVTIKTRARKQTVENRADLYAAWREHGVRLGLDLPGMVDAARIRAGTGKDLWERAIGIVRDAGQRAALIAGYIRERLGGSEKDPLAPVRSWAMKPAEIAAATSLASAVRSLSEREAAFSTHQLTKTALDLGLPITVHDVERQVAALKRQGQLIQGRGNRRDMLTTPGAISTERKLLELVTLGRGQGAPVIATSEQAGARLQAAARETLGHPLNMGQEAAGRLLLASPDRIVAVQGVAGAGKSSALGAVAVVARDEGRTVIGLGLQNTLVRMLERDTGIQSLTIAKFLGVHGRLLDPRTSPQRLELARAMFKGAILLVDEASMASNEQAFKLAALAERLQVGRLAFVGDKRQLGAIDAGKPFEVLQAAGAPSVEIKINLRARSPALISAAAAANDYRPRDALAALRPMTTEAPGRGAALAAKRWLALPLGDRERTMLLASGRQVRADINDAVQDGLLAQGALHGQGVALTVLDKVTTTREEERYLQTYAVGQRIDFERGLPSQGIEPGWARVIGIDRDKGLVELRDQSGKSFRFNPAKLAPNRTENSVRITRDKEVRLYQGDLIRWTASDRDRGLVNADRAKVLHIGPDGVTVETSTRMQLVLPTGDPMLQRLDLGYALNAHMAQGLTADRGIAVFDSRERNLTNERLFLVNITRVRDSLELIVDSGPAVERGIARNTGDKTAALETTGEVASGRDNRGPRASKPPQPTPNTAEPAPPAATIPNAPQSSPTPAGEVPQTKLPLPEKRLELGLGL